MTVRTEAAKRLLASLFDYTNEPLSADPSTWEEYIVAIESEARAAALREVADLIDKDPYSADKWAARRILAPILTEATGASGRDPVFSPVGAVEGAGMGRATGASE